MLVVDGFSIDGADDRDALAGNGAKMLLGPASIEGRLAVTIPRPHERIEA